MKTKFSGYKQAIFALILIFCSYAMYDVYICLQPAMLERLGITASALGVSTALQTVIGFVVSFFAGPIYKKVKPHVCLFLLVVFMLVFNLLCMFTHSYLLVVVMNVLYGLFVGLACQPATNIFISSWFIKNRDQMLSFVGTFANCGLALSGFIFSALAVRIESTVAGLIILAVFGVIGIIMSLLLRMPEKLGEKPLGYDEVPEATDNAVASDGFMLKEARKTSEFYVFALALLVTGMGVMIFSYGVLFASNKGYSESLSAMVSSFSFVGSAVGAILLGRLISKTNAKTFIHAVFILALVSVAVLFMWVKSDMPSAVVMIAILVGGIGNAGTNMEAPMLIPRLFGTKDFASFVPLYMAFLTIGIGAAAFILPTMATVSGNWISAMILSFACLIVGYVLSLVSLALSPMKKLNK